MKREILFRGKQKDNGEWVCGTPIFYSRGTTAMCKEYQRNENIDPKTVGQYTGLRDKNGKKIFEGDISKDKLVVTYIPQKASFCLAKRGWLFAHFFDEAIKVENGVAEIEIIGNIHDNPELLEEPS